MKKRTFPLALNLGSDTWVNIITISFIVSFLASLIVACTGLALFIKKRGLRNFFTNIKPGGLFHTIPKGISLTIAIAGIIGVFCALVCLASEIIQEQFILESLENKKVSLLKTIGSMVPKNPLPLSTLAFCIIPTIVAILELKKIPNADLAMSIGISSLSLVALVSVFLMVLYFILPISTIVDGICNVMSDIKALAIDSCKCCAGNGIEAK